MDECATKPRTFRFGHTHDEDGSWVLLYEGTDTELRLLLELSNEGVFNITRLDLGELVQVLKQDEALWHAFLALLARQPNPGLKPSGYLVPDPKEGKPNGR